jgi:hypothetical protein
MDKNSEIDFLFQYFLSQSDENFSGTIRSQKGNGVGNFFGGLCRTVMPLLKVGTALGNEIIRNNVKSIKKDSDDNSRKRKSDNIIAVNRSYKKAKKSKNSNQLKSKVPRKQLASKPTKKRVSTTNVRKIKTNNTKKKKVTNKIVKDIFSN